MENLKEAIQLGFISMGAILAIEGLKYTKEIGLLIQSNPMITLLIGIIFMALSGKIAGWIKQ